MPEAARNLPAVLTRPPAPRTRAPLYADHLPSLPARPRRLVHLPWFAGELLRAALISAPIGALVAVVFGR